MTYANGDYGGQMVGEDNCVLNFSTFVFELRKNTKKTLIRNLSGLKIELGSVIVEATTLPLFYSDGNCYLD